ncbi:unnamed protein product [Citrullus colocynthis]|uniref:Uncharacterized protein n=1 Tax=Citrullus colocynthis TaxID=252529 RepID=A0ABP0Z2F4_9ROSI
MSVVPSSDRERLVGFVTIPPVRSTGNSVFKCTDTGRVNDEALFAISVDFAPPYEFRIPELSELALVALIFFFTRERTGTISNFAPNLVKQRLHNDELERSAVTNSYFQLHFKMDSQTKYHIHVA